MLQVIHEGRGGKKACSTSTGGLGAYLELGADIPCRERALRTVGIATVLLLVLFEPCGSLAQEASAVHWQRHYRRWELLDAAISVTGALLYLGDMLLVPRREEPIWRGPILWDGPVRDALALRGRAQRDSAARMSDYLFTGSVVHNLVLDNLVVALAVHGEPEVAFQMSAIDLEAYAVAGALTGLIKTATGRERPFAQECRDDPYYTDQCGTLTSYRAFFSAHATTTAVGAGLLCAHHSHLPLYREAWLDATACGLGIAMTLVTGALRIASDKHWSTDVATGHLVGFASGYLIPTLFYYQWNDAGSGSTTQRTAVLPFVSPGQAGIQLLGWM